MEPDRRQAILSIQLQMIFFPAHHGPERTVLRHQRKIPYPEDRGRIAFAKRLQFTKTRQHRRNLPPVDLKVIPDDIRILRESVICKRRIQLSGAAYETTSGQRHAGRTGMSAITKEAVRRLIEQRLQIDAVPCPAGTFEDAASILTMI